MKMLRVWIVCVCVLLLTFSSLWGACSPVNVTGDQESNSSSEKGSSSGTDASSKDASSKDTSSTADEPSKDDTTSKDEPSKDDTTSKDEPSKDDTTSRDEPSKDDTASKDEPPKDEVTAKDDTTRDNPSSVDQDKEQTSPDNVTGQDRPVTDKATPLCETKGGYCDLGVGPCKTGYSNAGDPMGCAGGRSALCCLPKAPQCRSDADCPTTCSGSGVCTQVKYACIAGACKETGRVSQPNAKCNAATGQCVRLTPGCKVDCDCQQGFMCSNGQCLSGVKPVYCCDKAGCPSGAACTNKAGAKGTCPTTTTDCVKKSGYCTVQNTACKSGYKLNTAISCGTTRSMVCCAPVVNPCATIRCSAPVCKGTTGSCSVTSWACNPKTGKCEATTKSAKTTCQQSGTACTETIPSCSGNACTTAQKIYKLRTCSKTGTCVPTTVQCKVNCDCQQGFLCANGQCLSGTKPEWCCSKPNCPSGAACTDTSGNKGTCPTLTTDCVKKKGYCTAQNTACKTGYKLDASISCGTVRSLVCCAPVTNKCALILCKPPVCSTTRAGVCTTTKYTCDPNLGSCVASSKSVKSSCTMSGTTCSQQSAGCSNNSCVVKTSSSKLGCRQSGTSCVQNTPTCSNNSCAFVQKTYTLSVCSSTGQCVRKTPQCKVDCDCNQGQLCSGGQCLTGIVPVYCCEKAGCPAGQACKKKDGSSGTCPQAATDCSKKGGYCTVQFSACRTGYTLNTNVSCGSIRALQCCMPNVNKCATVKCSGPRCLMNSVGGCTQTSFTCDPSSGKCVASNKSLNGSCRMSGTSCVQSVPACSNNQCVASSKTVKAACKQSGTTCIQTIPSCGSNKCSSTTRTVTNSRCNTTSGQCSLTGISCATIGGVCIGNGRSCPTGSTPITALSCPNSGDLCCAKLTPGPTP